MKKVYLAFMLFCLLCFAYSLIEPTIITVKTYNISNKQLKGMKIVFLTDFHRSSINSEGKIKRIVEKTNSLNPDIIILGGDYVTKPNDKYIDSVFNELKNLKANVGIYGVLGNHDYEMSYYKLGTSQIKIKNKIKEHFNLLDDTIYNIEYNNAILKLGGISDMWKETPDIDINFDDNENVIMVSHNPDYAEHVSDKNIDLLLSGHTHGGQITLFGLFAPYIPSDYRQKYRTGLISNGNVDVIVSNGLGTILLPMRFFALPQIVEINYI